MNGKTAGKAIALNTYLKAGGVRVFVHREIERGDEDSNNNGRVQ